MAIKTESLDNAERDMELLDRESKGSKRAVVAVTDPEAQLLALRQKIRAGQNKVGDDPRPKDAPACQECFQRGWLAAMQSLEK